MTGLAYTACGVTPVALVGVQASLNTYSHLNPALLSGCPSPTSKSSSAPPFATCARLRDCATCCTCLPTPLLATPDPPAFTSRSIHSMSESIESHAKLSPEVSSVERPGPHQRCKHVRWPESNSFSATQQGSSELTCASSRPEHPQYSAPTFDSRTTDPPNTHGHPHGSLPYCRAMPSQLSPYPQSLNRHRDDNGKISPEQSSSKAVEARPFSFFDFPPEIRNMIYNISLQRPACADLYRCYYKYNAARPKNKRWARPHLKTPTILLLCKRITDESMPVLRARWFIIDRLPPCAPPLPDGRGGFMRLANFIGRETLQRLEYIDLRIGLGEGPLGSGWIWNRMLDELLAILKEKNALVHFRLLIRRCNKEENRSIWFTEDMVESDIRKVCAPSPWSSLWADDLLTCHRKSLHLR